MEKVDFEAIGPLDRLQLRAAGVSWLPSANPGYSPTGALRTGADVFSLSPDADEPEIDPSPTPLVQALHESDGNAATASKNGGTDAGSTTDNSAESPHQFEFDPGNTVDTAPVTADVAATPLPSTVTAQTTSVPGGLSLPAISGGGAAPQSGGSLPDAGVSLAYSTPGDAKGRVQDDLVLNTKDPGQATAEANAELSDQQMARSGSQGQAFKAQDEQMDLGNRMQALGTTHDQADWSMFDAKQSVKDAEQQVVSDKGTVQQQTDMIQSVAKQGTGIAQDIEHAGSVIDDDQQVATQTKQDQGSTQDSYDKDVQQLDTLQGQQNQLQGPDSSTPSSSPSASSTPNDTSSSGSSASGSQAATGKEATAQPAAVTAAPAPPAKGNGHGHGNGKGGGGEDVPDSAPPAPPPAAPTKPVTTSSSSTPPATSKPSSGSTATGIKPVSEVRQQVQSSSNNVRQRMQSTQARSQALDQRVANLAQKMSQDQQVQQQEQGVTGQMQKQLEGNLKTRQSTQDVLARDQGSLSQSLDNVKNLGSQSDNFGDLGNQLMAHRLTADKSQQLNQSNAGAAEANASRLLNVVRQLQSGKSGADSGGTRPSNPAAGTLSPSASGTRTPAPDSQNSAYSQAAATTNLQGSGGGGQDSVRVGDDAIYVHLNSLQSGGSVLGGDTDGTIGKQRSNAAGSSDLAAAEIQASSSNNGASISASASDLQAANAPQSQAATPQTTTAGGGGGGAQEAASPGVGPGGGGPPGLADKGGMPPGLAKKGGG